ncbi:glycosyltransferase [Novosphingobium mangrovi (ex Hu et al. 2023)]|uniref:Glycosyltransferase n=1 Tax=Novosphingobium mangrovi (ex Hu et al. 2023) TaxID=2930094 RepID=A0ABT0AI60_9SPHN|nr:glycosyltransferase [Novosphingobium mangrovi (ex Hu et al. 2023)]MCJ1962867.1 glycosyltransferase [Novosphingobium mangrovi (ex Hu et al. 2023)]
MRGGERVLEHICDMFPEADIFTHVVDPAKLSDKLRARRIETTFIARLPGARTHYQKYLPLMPRALEGLDLTDYDLVISSEAGPAKGVITRPDATHVTYCHSPMRYIWDQYHQYRSTGGLGARISMPLFAPALRTWDVASAARSDLIMANSAYIRARIGKFWGRDARVVHPPVDTALFTPVDTHDEEYLWVGQLVSYKRPDLAVDAFSASGRKLHVVGDGPMFEELRARAAPNVRFTRRLDFTALRAAYARARALVFTGEEDFGMIPVEVMASGRPVIAYGRGGALETVVEGETGLFFRENSAPALNAALTRFESWEAHFVPEAAVRQARRFSPEVFRTRFLETIERAQALGHRPYPAAPQALSA